MAEKRGHSEGRLEAPIEILSTQPEVTLSWVRSGEGFPLQGNRTALQAAVILPLVGASHNSKEQK